MYFEEACDDNNNIVNLCKQMILKYLQIKYKSNYLHNNNQSQSSFIQKN